MDSSSGFIIKASGEHELFSEEKLTNSLSLAGASQKAIRIIADHVRDEIKEGTTSADIYGHALSLLKRYERRAAARYNLKRALMAIGPSGHPFERLIGEILKSQGYSVEVGKVVEGFCVRHEVDAIARKGDEIVLVEAKFHNRQGIKSDVKVPLYVHARFEDILKRYGKDGAASAGARINKAWIVTNTKFTSEAVEYGECADIRMIGWNHPHDGNLRDIIEDAGLHPLTCLTSLSAAEKQYLLNNNIVLSRDIKNNAGILLDAVKNKVKANRVIKEAELLYG